MNMLICQLRDTQELKKYGEIRKHCISGHHVLMFLGAFLYSLIFSHVTLGLFVLSDLFSCDLGPFVLFDHFSCDLGPFCTI